MATADSFCHLHDPHRAEQRRRDASRGGKAGGNGRPGTGEIVDIKKEIRGVIGGVLTGRVERSTGATMFMGFNTLLRAVEVARKIKETEELEERIEALESQDGGSRAWG